MIRRFLIRLVFLDGETVAFVDEQLAGGSQNALAADDGAETIEQRGRRVSKHGVLIEEARGRQWGSYCLLRYPFTR
jgi:hypothetical protein